MAHGAKRMSAREIESYLLQFPEDLRTQALLTLWQQRFINTVEVIDLEPLTIPE